jgi:hypothetical protein
MKNHRNIFESPDIFPKVDMIRGRKISPEIDVLSRNFETKTLVGYEFKFLNKRRDTNYRSIREGLAQTIEYFQYGIDKSYLVLGIHAYERPETTVNYWADGVTTAQTILRALERAYHLDSLGLLLWIEDRDLIQCCNRAKRNFPIERLTDSQFDGYRLDRECLFADSFHWNLGFWKKYELGVIGFWAKTCPKHKSPMHREKTEKS